MHLVAFIIRIFHDARSPERQITSNLRQDQYKFMILSLSDHYRMTNVSDRGCGENQNTFYVQ